MVGQHKNSTLYMRVDPQISKNSRGSKPPQHTPPKTASSTTDLAAAPGKKVSRTIEKGSKAHYLDGSKDIGL